MSAHYGVDDPRFPAGFVKQLMYPFAARTAPASESGTALSELPSALGSPRPQRES